MTTTAWTAGAAPGAAGSSRLRRWGTRAAVALVLLAIVLWGVFTWLLYNPFEGMVESLDRCIPPSVTFALHGSAEDLFAAPFVKDRVLGREDVSERLGTWGVEAALANLEREQAAVNDRLPSFLGGFDLRADLLGRETVVFGNPRPGTVITPEDPLDLHVAVATRVSARARRVLSLLKHDWMRRRIEAESGIALTRYPNAYSLDLGAGAPHPAWGTLYAALERDVLIVGNDRDLVTKAAHLAAAGGAGSLPERSDAGMAFAPGASEPLRAFVDLAQAADAAERAGEPTLGARMRDGEGPAGLLGPLLDLDNLATGQMRLSFPGAARVRLEASGVRGAAGLSSLASDLTDGRVRPAAEALREASLLAPAGSAVLAARMEARVGVLLRVLEARAEPALRKEIARTLEESGNGLEEVAAELDDYLSRGLSVVVERLPECDGIALDIPGADPDGKFILPLPGMLFALRQREGLEAGSAERMFRRRLEEWRGNLSVLEDLEGLPEGMRGIRFRPKFLTGEKDLVRPVVAFEGDLVLLATNEGMLRRALEARAGKRPALSDFPGFEEACREAGEGQCAAFLETGAALLMAADQRREAASAAIATDDRLVRRRIHSEVALRWMQDQKEIRQEEIQAEVDRRFEEWERLQRDVEFPRAAREYLEGLEPWKGIRSVAGTLAWDSSGPRILFLLRAAGEE